MYYNIISRMRNDKIAQYKNTKVYNSVILIFKSRGHEGDDGNSMLMSTTDSFFAS